MAFWAHAANFCRGLQPSRFHKSNFSWPIGEGWWLILVGKIQAESIGCSVPPASSAVPSEAGNTTIFCVLWLVKVWCSLFPFLSPKP